MAFRRIEEIRIGTMPPGEAFNGYIYDLKIAFGFNGSPTTVTISVINEDGIYYISENDLSTLNFIPIYITEPGGGNDPRKRFIHLNMMHLVEYNIQKTTDAKILVLEFVDHSIILDKIWVGLANKSAKTHNLMARPGFINNYKYLFRNLTVPVKCHPCTKRLMKDPATGQFKSLATREKPPYGTGRPWGIPPVPPLPPGIEERRIRYLAGGGFVSNIDPLLGGALLIGTQEFSNSECSIKEVSYNWRELEFALAKNNILIATRVDGVPSINDRGRPHYRSKTADKPLKDVINAWCQELGFDWTWDPFTNMIFGRDLSVSMINLWQIQNRVENWEYGGQEPFPWEGAGGRSIITNLNMSHTLKGSKRQDHVSKYSKPARKKVYDTTRYKRVISENVEIDNLIPEDQFGMGRTLEEFTISCSLAKFSTEARELYNVGLAAEKFPVVFPAGGAGANIPEPGALEPLGISWAYKFSPQEQNALWQLFGGANNLRPEDKNKPLDAAFTDFHAKPQHLLFDVYLAVYNETIKGKWEKWEQDVADFIGKWYTNDKEDRNLVDCQPNAAYSLKVDNHPIAGNVYDVDDVLDLPFGELMRGAPCAGVQDNCRALGDANTFNLFRTCWGQKIGDQAWRGTNSEKLPSLTGKPQNPNNQCCAFLQGIAQGQRLVRGKTYRFAQTDRSWRLGNNDWQGCNQGEDACGAARGGELMITRADGSAAGLSYTYVGTPGEPDSYAQITIPGGRVTTNQGKPVTEVLYLSQPAGPMKTMGCGCDTGIVAGTCLDPLEPDRVKHFQFLDGSNGFGEPFKERFMVIADEGDEDTEQLFVFKREAQWGINDEDLDRLILNKEKVSQLQWLLPKKYAITEQTKNDFMKRFAVGGAAGMGGAAPGANAVLAAPFVDKLGDVGNNKIFLIFMPKKAHLDNYFKIGEKGLEDAIDEDGKKTINKNERVFEKNKKAEGQKSCRTICDVSFISRVCRCWPGRDFDVAPETNGLSSNAARSFTMHVMHRPIFKKDAQGKVLPGKPIDVPHHWRETRVILPSEFSFWGYHSYAIKYTQIVRPINATAGLIIGGMGAMSYNVNLKDITQDMDDLSPTPADEAIDPTNPVNQLGQGAGLPGWEGGGKIVVNLMVPSNPGNPYGVNQRITSMESFHNNLLQGGNVINNDYPSQSLEFTVVGGYVGPIVGFINPQYGCESLSITYGSQGLQTSFRFSTRYPTPVPDQMLFQKISPELNLNIFGRTF